MYMLAFVMLIAFHEDDVAVPCGADSLAKCLIQIGKNNAVKEVVSLLPRHGVDASFLELKQTAEALGVSCRAARWDKRFPEGAPPAIIRVILPNGKSHFVAVLQTKGNSILVSEGDNSTWMSDTTLRNAKWDGIALHFSKSSFELFCLGRVWPLFGLVLIILITPILFSVLFSVLCRAPRWGLASKSRRVSVAEAQKARQGATLVEMLVCLAILVLLLALLSPAIQTSRERARALTCMNNLKQIGLAMSGFAEVNGRFPPAASQQLLKNLVKPDITPFSVSAHYNLLPFLDLAAIQSGIDFENDVWTDSDPPMSNNNSKKLNALRVPVFLCPSDRSVSWATNYVTCNGTSTNIHTTDSEMPNSSRMGFSYCGVGVRPTDISDGLSNTVAFSERLLGAGVPSKYVPSRDIAIEIVVNPPPIFPDDGVLMCQENVTMSSSHTSFSGVGWLFFGRGTSYNQILPPNSSVPDCQMGTSNTSIGVFTARSLHISGCHVLLGDGAVRFANQSIDEALWRGLGTTNSADPAELP